MKIAGLICLAAILVSTLSAGIYNVAATAAASADYSESYRNQLAYSAKEGWNNDPNGLLYVNGTYHMYYQYTYKDGQTKPQWDDMSWGHATSSDLVRWEEKPVAIPAYQTVDGKFYGMMFSGSAVYDENNTSGLFDINPDTGKVSEGQGIVAILTQPNDEAGGQRQILAYSKDNGTNFTVYKEILGANAEGSLGDGEFRDPKVFWNEKTGKWLMAVGGGAVRMYSSENLIDWSYLGQTGFWGECPDISRFEVNGEEKYLLIISPEDKENSHKFNGTTRADTYYPAEYYAVGELDANGLFRATQPIKRLSQGIDSYAFQSFNNAPDGKVYGVSWAASWKSVGEYESYRKTYNGGMTGVCELKLIKEGGEYVVTRCPVDNFKTLRDNTVFTYSGKLTAGGNALQNAFAEIADIEAQLDFTGSNATYAELNLRVSSAERITLRYDVKAQTLTLDRSKSSLLAKDTSLYKIPYSTAVPLSDGKLSLRVLLDRAFISVFANDGRASYFSAVFPSAVSNGMELVSDGEIGANVEIFSLNGIFGEVQTVDGLCVTADKIDTTVGSFETVIASSFASDFNENDVRFYIKSGDCVSLTQNGATANLKANGKGTATVTATYRGQFKDIEIYVYENGFDSDVEYGMRYGGFSYIRDDGLFFASGKSDAFMFGSAKVTNFKYSATFKPDGNVSQAGGLVFGVSENYMHYFVATADVKDNRLKLWEAGVGDLNTVPYVFESSEPIKLTVTVNSGTVRVYVNDGNLPAVIHKINGFAGGVVGLNVYNSDMVINNVKLTSLAYDGGFDVGAEQVIKVVNVTDSSYRLNDGEYTVADGKVTISESYLNTLEANTEYTFRAITHASEYDFTVKTDFIAATLSAVKNNYLKGEDVSFAVSDGDSVTKLEIDGIEYAFTFDNGTITVSAEQIKNLIGGEHVVKVYTSKGRPTASFNISGLEDFREEDVETVSHVFFWVDIAVFALLIVGYITFMTVKKCGKQKGGKK